MKELLLENFIKISSIPRGTGKEKQISDFFVDLAINNKLEYYQDENYNVLIKKKGNIDGDSIAIQSHLDMVCVKREGSNHDFSKDPIEVIVDGDVVKAKDTSLGADQGVGLALMMTLIEANNIKHPNLEFMFTVEEETTFKGAVTFPYAKVESKKIINLDSGNDEIVVIGSAGDIANEYTFEGNFIKNELPCYKISISGLEGGNSGDNVEKSTNNAIIKMANLIDNKDIYICSINGGFSENDIATNCEAIIKTSLNIKELFDSSINIEEVKYNYSFSLEDTQRIIKEIKELKSGYLSNTASANLGIIKTSQNKIIIDYIIRSTNESELEKLNMFINNLDNNFNAKNIYTDSIWIPNRESRLLKEYNEVYYSLFSKYPKENIAQGGLECVAIKKRITNSDVISIGASMINIHSVDEETYISSWEKIYNLLLKLLSN